MVSKIYEKIVVAFHLFSFSLRNLQGTPLHHRSRGWTPLHPWVPGSQNPRGPRMALRELLGKFIGKSMVFTMVFTIKHIKTLTNLLELWWDIKWYKDLKQGSQKFTWRKNGPRNWPRNCMKFPISLDKAMKATSHRFQSSPPVLLGSDRCALPASLAALSAWEIIGCNW